MGHYYEKNIKFDINLAQLSAEGGKLIYEMVFDSTTSNWELVVVQDAQRNPVGAAEFTQRKAPAN